MRKEHFSSPLLSSLLLGGVIAHLYFTGSPKLLPALLGFALAGILILAHRFYLKRKDEEERTRILKRYGQDHNA